MKKSFILCFAFLTLLASSNPLQAQAKSVDWPEKKAFHSVMSTTFHPSEEGNLDPIKTRSGEMVEKAREWMKSTPPPAFNKPTIKKKLKLLYKESIALDKLVKSKGTDEKIKKDLSKLHDRFHEIVEICHHDEGH